MFNGYSSQSTGDTESPDHIMAMEDDQVNQRVAEILESPMCPNTNGEGITSMLSSSYELLTNL